jgi:DNA (cytosine-5)-methyltransferase 1
MKYLSVCSGIEAASVAWHPLGWEAVGYSEIEPFPSAVLKHHYPDVTNFGDMTKFKEWNLDSIDLLVGGTPCQSFSVAGLRKGLEDPRGNLALVYCGILDHFRPQWFVWENVPGVLSSNGGRDFGSFLGALAELGYGFAYRVLDAQYFGVAQRRRRVFVVGYLGDWRPAAEVLFERESVCGNPARSREKRQEAASGTPNSVASGKPTFGTLSANAGTKLWLGNQEALSGDYHILQPIIAKCITTKTRHNGVEETLISAYAIQGSMIGRSDNAGPQGDGINEEICFTQNTTDRHAVAQPIAFEPGKLKRLGYGYAEPGLCPTLMADAGDNQLAVAQPVAYNIAPGKGALKDDIHVTKAEVTKTLDASGSNPAMHQGGAAVIQPIYMGNAEGGAKEVPFLTCHNLGGTAGISNQTPLIGQPITFSGQMSVPQTDVDMSATLQAKNPMAVAQPMAFTCSEQSNSFAWEKPYAPTITAQTANDTSNIQKGVRVGMAVRRLTPVECERLQGFPDNYTNIPWRKSDESPDGPRYKALGNSMAVPVMAWIGQRIANYKF